jgi:hypothetical protein
MRERLQHFAASGTQQLLCVKLRRETFGLTGEHSCQLHHALRAIQARRTRHHSVSVGALHEIFDDRDLMICESRHLGKVGNDENLAVSRKFGQGSNHRHCRLATDARIDLVEDKRLRAGVSVGIQPGP